MIGNMLKFMRKTRNYKQDEIAKIINVKSNTISQYENNNRQATFEIINKISKYCDFEIIFKDKTNNKEYTLNSIERKDI